MTWERMPWRVALSEERCLPSGVFGPHDFLAFSRLARRLASETRRLGLAGGGAAGVSVSLLLISFMGGSSIRLLKLLGITSNRFADAHGGRDRGYWYNANVVRTTRCARGMRI